MKRTRAAVPAALALMLLVAGWADAAPITPVKVIGGGADQQLPSANADWIAWSTNSENANRYDAVVRSLVGGVPTGPTTTLNGPATFGWAPDLLAGGSDVVFQQANSRQDVSNIWIADLDVLPVHKSQPPGLNTRAWEWRPMITDSWILFGRQTRTHNGIFLYNRTTYAVRKLANPRINRQGSPSMIPSDVNESYATWTHCSAAGCNVFYYNIATRVTTHVPNPNGAIFYDGGLSATTGDIYFARSGRGCGVAVKVLRWHIGDGPSFTTVASLPAGFDEGGKIAVFNDGANDNVYFGRIRCGGRFYSDIYEVPAADTA